MVLPESSRRSVSGWLIRRFSLHIRDWQQTLLQSGQAGASGGSEEAKVTHFHEAARQDVLEEALDEMLHGEGTGLELAGV